MRRGAPLALVGSLLVGCGARTLETTPTPPPRPATSAPPLEEPAAKGGVWSECYASFTPSGVAKTDLGRLTRDCGATGGMRAITPVRTGEQSETDPADRYTFYVPSTGACYRVFAAADRTVQDLDLLLRGPEGDDVVADISHDSYPVLPPAGPICFDVPGLYLLEVSVFRGSGKYALQVWGNPAGLGGAPAPKPRHASRR